jgi:peptide deformylase
MAKMLKMYNNSMIEYEILPLVDFYDPILRTPTKLWDFDAKTAQETQLIAYSMMETLAKYKGLALSANQVGLPYRMFAMNTGDKIWLFFNPQIIEQGKNPSPYTEGCLSYPGLYLKLNRPDHVKMRFQAMNGEYIEKEFDGLTAVCVQHEIDHLDGIVYTSRVSPIKLEQAKRKVKKNLKKIKSITAGAA